MARGRSFRTELLSWECRGSRPGNPDARRQRIRNNVIENRKTWSNLGGRKIPCDNFLEKLGKLEKTKRQQHRRKHGNNGFDAGFDRLKPRAKIETGFFQKPYDSN